MKLPKLGSTVLVTWIDSTAWNGWRYFGANQRIELPARLIETLGWVVDVTSDVLTLCSSISQPNKFNLNQGQSDHLSIPLGCIKKIQKISPKK